MNLSRLYLLRRRGFIIRSIRTASFFWIIRNYDPMWNASNLNDYG